MCVSAKPQIWSNFTFLYVAAKFVRVQFSARCIWLSLGVKNTWSRLGNDYVYAWNTCFFFSSQFRLDISRGLVKNKVSFKVASSVTFTNVETKARNRPDINCQHFILATSLHSVQWSSNRSGLEKQILSMSSHARFPARNLCLPWMQGSRWRWDFCLCFW